ncbi:Coenzyme F420 hydrogenase/dehydrogenase, beta subunit C-terminal domain [Clostridium perfringens]
MKKNVSNISDELCTGCGVCATICPTRCIDIKLNNNGFYKASVSEEKCVDCQMCQRVCYKFISTFGDFKIKQEESFNINNSNVYLSYALDNETRLKSSSGGIGTELVKYALDNNCSVCGAEYNYNQNKVNHIIFDSQDGITRIRGSKYIPSSTLDAFSKFDNNKKYLVIGTPCQIYGLRKSSELKKKDNFIFVDFFCHGTPSLNLWYKYLDYIKREYDIDEIVTLDFRNKDEGWHKFSMKIIGKNGRVYSKNLDEDMFMQFFLQNVDLSESCHDCKLRFNKIYSDIRLGDFWGPKCNNDELGTSIVLSNTAKGEKILKELNGIFLEEVSFEDLKLSQYIEKLEVPKIRTIVQEEIKGIKKIEEIYNENIVPMKRKKIRKYIFIRIINKLKKIAKKLSVVKK